MTLHVVVARCTLLLATHNCKTNERANKWEVQPSRDRAGAGAGHWSLWPKIKPPKKAPVLLACVAAFAGTVALCRFLLLPLKWHAERSRRVDDAVASCKRPVACVCVSVAAIGAEMRTHLGEPTTRSSSWSSWNQKLSHVPHLLVNLFLVNV